MKLVRTLKMLLLAIISAVLMTTAAWPAGEPPPSQTKTVKGYTTKSGKVVKPYERKASSKPNRSMKAEEPTPPPPPEGTRVKGYTTKSGKVVQPYERKAGSPPRYKATAKESRSPLFSSEGKTVHVSGYTTKKGKVVAPYMRRPPTKKRP